LGIYFFSLPLFYIYYIIDLLTNQNLISVKIWPGTNYPILSYNSCLRARAGATQESGCSLYYITLLRTIRTRARNPLLLYLVVLLPYPTQSFFPTLPTLLWYYLPYPYFHISYISIIILPYPTLDLPTYPTPIYLLYT
jgi:hypothetical protein